MTGRWRALARLFSLQGSWNYERMQGVGMGYAAEPLLDDLKVADPTRHSDAVIRSAEFFNANPYLAGLALGATVRAEYDGVPGDQIVRLRTALAGPLGALGDGLFWAGVLPAAAGITLAAVALGAGWRAVVAFLLIFNALRLFTARWALRTGLANGMRVGAAISASMLPQAATRMAVAAALSIGIAVPIVAAWLLRPFGATAGGAALLVAAIGLVLGRWLNGGFTAPRYGLMALGVTLVLRWVLG
jgi:mannose PTS system EIID component